MGTQPLSTGLEEQGARPFLFDFAAFERMDEAGVFADRPGRVELIEGVIVEMAPPGFDHTVVNSELMGQLYIAMKAAPIRGLRVLTHGTLRIDDHSAPEPDIFVASTPSGRRHYQASDAVLVIEIAVSTVETDRRIKGPLYARAGIPELWIVEPEARSICVYRGPRPDGTWDSETTLLEGAVTPLFAPEIRIALSDLFPAA